MGSFSVSMLILISILTVFMAWLIVRGEPQNCKIVYFFIIIGVFMYSGVGIAYESVDDTYVVYYAIFLFALLFSIKFIFHIKKGYGSKRTILYQKRLKSTIDEDIDVAADSIVVKLLAILYLCTLAIYLFVPSFRIMDFFRPHFANIVINNVYATNAANQSNIILKLASTLNIMSLPFFCVYIYHLIENNKKTKGVLLIVLSIYLDFLQKNYLGRYKMVILFVYVFFVIAFVRKEQFKIDMKKLGILGLMLMASVPFLYSFISLRSGGTINQISFIDSLELLLESEVYYPKYYDICSSIFSENGSLGLRFIIYLICLPIPSIVFPGKPTVNASFYLTYAETGRWFGDANYTSCLPSVVGEGMIIWGPMLIFLHGIVLGVVIGIFFRFLMRYKSLTVLYIYYAVNLLALGRGGAESYLSGLVNGTIILILWVFILKKYRQRDMQRIE